MNDSDLVTATYTINLLQTVATPSFIPSSNTTFLLNQQVSIFCATSDATIYYTTDGTVPTTSSIQYITPFTITTTTVIKAIATKNGMTNSDISTATYTKTEKVASPTFNPLNGSTFTTSQQVAISCTTSDALMSLSDNFQKQVVNSGWRLIHPAIFRFK